MVWISFLLISLNIYAAELPRFLTKQSIDSIRFITMDGRHAYVKKGPGVLGVVSSFRGTDFLTEPATSDFLMRGSRFRQRLLIEVIPNTHNEYNLLKNNKILVVDWGGSQVKEIGYGQKARLHVRDEWVTYYQAYEKIIFIQNVITQKKYQIRLSNKANPFFTPDVEMVNPETVVYTDINETGYSGLISYNLLTQKSTVIYRSPQTATKLELCQHDDYLGVGEFPFEGVNRGSKILQIKLGDSTNLAGYSTIYSSSEQDIGNIICLRDSMYFIKTTVIKDFGSKETEAAKLDIKSQKVQIMSKLQTVSHLIEVDERVMIPHRGDHYVLEGDFNLSKDALKSVPIKEELPLEI